MFKKGNVKPTKHRPQPALLASGTLVSTAIRTKEGAVMGYACAKISLKEDDVPTLFPVVEAMLKPPIRRTQAATRSSTTTFHLGSKRAVSAKASDVGSW